YKLTMCCYCGHEGGGHTLIRNNFVGQKINWDRVFKIKNMFRRYHKKGKINKSCIGCPFLKEAKWDNENYINNLYISHWTNCNCKCVYCYATQHPDDFKVAKLYNTMPYIKEMFEKGILKQGGIISFGGGEPTLLDEFEEMINFFLDNYFWGIRVHSSGIKYSPALARAINEIRGYVVVSVDSGSAETYEKIKNVPCYDKVRETIRKYALQTTFLGRYLVSAKYIIIPGINDNIEEIDKWMTANYNEGLYTTVLDIEENWYLANKDNIPKHIFELINYAEKKAKQLHSNFELYERLQNMIADEKAKHKTLFSFIKN
ncbi:MAG: radical SAM protein, partial [Candidatus Gastranaerophilales bacterium]|nr:radical SAM protein [Candidatus Gastranaerophilales bacterium]